MRTVAVLFTTAAAALGAACDSKTLSVCADIPEQRVYTGETGMVAPCFDYPEDGALTVAVDSPEPSVVTAAYLGDSVVFKAVSPGSGVVIVTATDEKGLTARTAFLVVVPNRPPAYATEVESARVRLDRSLSWDLEKFFREPDGEEMTFTATSSESAIAAVSLLDNRVRVTGLSGGDARVTLKATDPHGSEATATIRIFVSVRTTMVDDGFDGKESLDDWTEEDATLSVRDGSLHIEPKIPGNFGVASRKTDGVTHFDIDFGFKPAAKGRTGVIWRTGHSDIEAYLFLTGELIVDNDHANWVFAWLSSGRWHTAYHGESDYIELGKFSHYHISLRGESVKIAAGGGLVLGRSIRGAAPALHEIRLVAEGGTGQFDYVALSGFPLESPGANTRKTTLPLPDIQTRR